MNTSTIVVNSHVNGKTLSKIEVRIRDVKSEVFFVIDLLDVFFCCNLSIGSFGVKIDHFEDTRYPGMDSNTSHLIFLGCYALILRHLMCFLQ